MKFFNLKDFEVWQHSYSVHDRIMNDIVDLANAKLERDSKVVYGYDDDRGAWTFEGQGIDGDTHKALLINIEPIKKCAHPAEKVTKFWITGRDGNGWTCHQCGREVKALTFGDL